MLVYITWRFEFKFAVGGIIALVHDVAIAVGLFTLLGRTFSLTVLAAVLSIVGFSINDTIVVYDRIRELLRREGKRPFRIHGRARFPAEAGGLYSLLACQERNGPLYWVRDENSLACASEECPAE